MTFVIEKNIPIGKQVRKSKYPFAQMENGDSFFVPTGDQDPHRVASRIHNHARHQNVRIATRQTENGIRVWKIDTLINQD